MRRITSSYYNHYYNMNSHKLFMPLHRFMILTAEMDDLKSLVRRELLWAMINWNPGKHKRLISYAIQRVRRRLQHFVRDEVRHIRRFVAMDDEILALVDKPVSSPLLNPIIEEVLAVVTPAERQAILGTMRDGKSLRALAQETGMKYDFIWRARNSGLAKIRTRFPDPSDVLP